MPYPDLLDPASRSRPALRRPFPVFGTVLLALAIVGAGLLFVPSTRLIGLLLVLPVGGAVLYVWFRNREQTNGVLTVTGLAVLAVTLGIGVAMTIAARTAPAVAATHPDPSTAARSGSTVGYVGTVVGPTPEPAPKITLTPTAPLPVDRTTHRFETVKPRKTTEPTSKSPDSDSDSSASAQPSSTPTADVDPDSRNDTDSRNNTDSRNDSDSRNNTDSESARATHDRRSEHCSYLGETNVNKNHTADVCLDRDDHGHLIWRRNVPPPD